ncbi:MAG: MFS transporter [Bacteroidales bacterium]|nr:MFS transporter [Bacteroidales bacterium]
MPKINNNINLKANRNRYVFHGFFLAGAISIADTSTVLPLIINFFNGDVLLVGILSSLMKGGVIIMQLWTAFKAQEHKFVLSSLKKVFIFRFLTWFSVGLSILLFSGASDVIVLVLISIFLFLFSFSAGVGIIYYQELLGKSFTKEYRGKVIAIKQIASGTAGIISGGISAFILKSFNKPESFSYLFIISAIFIAISYVIFWNFKEPEKEQVSKKENNFKDFLINAGLVLKSDRNLQFQIWSRFLSYGLFLIFPFIILKAKDDLGIRPEDIGVLIALQPAGAVLGNFLWAFLSSRNRNKYVILISFGLVVLSVLGTFIATDIWYYYIIYFLLGASVDGFRLAFSNLILIIAPENKRPVYIAIQNNLSSLGLFFAIPGGMILRKFDFSYLAYFTLFVMLAGIIFSIMLKKE